MTLLDNRRTQILDMMGVSVWRLRNIRNCEQADDERACSEIIEGDMINTVPVVDEVPDLVEIAFRIANCEKCQLHAGRHKTVPGAGNPNADWMFVGEAPGQAEDLQGLPFVGRAGQLLDLMIAALGMERSQVFVANIIKCRPPNNRDPQPQEVEQCESYLHAQLENIHPKIIIALGRVSAQALLKSTESLGSLRGRIYQYGPAETPLLVTYHPAYLLRSPSQKAKVWQDLLLAKSHVN